MSPGSVTGHSVSQRCRGGYNPPMLSELQLNDTVLMRKAHPCGSFEWKVTRLGADIGLECLACRRRVMLTRRELMRRAKSIVPANQIKGPNKEANLTP